METAPSFGGEGYSRCRDSTCGPMGACGSVRTLPEKGHREVSSRSTSLDARQFAAFPHRRHHRRERTCAICPRPASTSTIGTYDDVFGLWEIVALSLCGRPLDVDVIVAAVIETRATEVTAFVLGVDRGDGVCADFYAAMRPIVAEWLGVDEATLSEKFTYGLKEWGVRDTKHYKGIHRFAVTQRDLFGTVPVITGAGASLRRLSDQGVHIRIITHRLFISYFHQEAVRQTVEWLYLEAIPYWDLCFVKEKVDVGADLYIEDSPDNIEALERDNKPVIVFTNPTNEDLDAQLRADTWDDVEGIVRHQIAKAGKNSRAPPSEGPANEAV